MLLSFLKEFSRLTPAQQEIFLFCLEKCPRPIAYTNDVTMIVTFTGRPRKTIFRAFSAFAQSNRLSDLVCYTRKSVKHTSPVKFDDKILYRVLVEGGNKG